jgi:hypothetical protein
LQAFQSVHGVASKDGVRPLLFPLSVLLSALVDNLTYEPQTGNSGKQREKTIKLSKTFVGCKSTKAKERRKSFAIILF